MASRVYTRGGRIITRGGRILTGPKECVCQCGDGGGGGGACKCCDYANNGPCGLVGCSPPWSLSIVSDYGTMTTRRGSCCGEVMVAGSQVYSTLTEVQSIPNFNCLSGASPPVSAVAEWFGGVDCGLGVPLIQRATIRHSVSFDFRNTQQNSNISCQNDGFIGVCLTAGSAFSTNNGMIRCFSERDLLAIPEGFGSPLTRPTVQVDGYFDAFDNRFHVSVWFGDNTSAYSRWDQVTGSITASRSGGPCVGACAVDFTIGARNRDSGGGCPVLVSASGSLRWTVPSGECEPGGDLEPLFPGQATPGLPGA